MTRKITNPKGDINTFPPLKSDEIDLIYHNYYTSWWCPEEISKHTGHDEDLVSLVLLGGEGEKESDMEKVAKYYHTICGFDITTIATRLELEPQYIKSLLLKKDKTEIKRKWVAKARTPKQSVAPPPRRTHIELEELEKLVMCELNIRQISDELNMDYQVVSEHLKRYRLKCKYKVQPNIHRLKYLRKSGVTKEQVAQTLNMSVEAIENWENKQ